MPFLHLLYNIFTWLTILKRAKLRQPGQLTVMLSVQEEDFTGIRLLHCTLRRLLVRVHFAQTGLDVCLHLFKHRLSSALQVSTAVSSCCGSQFMVRVVEFWAMSLWSVTPHVSGWEVRICFRVVYKLIFQFFNCLSWSTRHAVLPIGPILRRKLGLCIRISLICEYWWPLCLSLRRWAVTFWAVFGAPLWTIPSLSADCPEKKQVASVIVFRSE